MVPLPLCLGCQVSEANSTEFQWTGSDRSETANKLHSGLCFHIFCKCFREKYISTDTETYMIQSETWTHFQNCNKELSFLFGDVRLLERCELW